MTKRDGSKARASAICITVALPIWSSGGIWYWRSSQAARKSGCRVAISAAKGRDFKALPDQCQAWQAKKCGEERL
jgi:hypothetical protein